MFAKERQLEIADEVNRNGRVLVNDLAAKYNVTKDLIRKDLNVLERDGLVKKVYGGAVAVRDNPRLYTVNSRKEDNPEGRQEIAEKAAALIQEGDTIYLDVSVTSILIARILNTQNRKCKVITGMIDVLVELAPDENIQIFFLGGHINQERDGFWSAVSLNNLRHYHVDKAFLGTVGIDIDRNTVSTYHEGDGVLKAETFRLSKEIYALADTRKFHEDGEFTYAHLTDFTAMITDSTLEDELKKAMAEKEITVL